MIIITYTHEFLKEYKRLSKKYPSLETDIKKLIENLSVNPALGTPLGAQLFKIRWQVKSKGQGKSGGIRVITYFKVDMGKLRMMTIYDKSEKETISMKELRELIKSEK